MVAKPTINVVAGILVNSDGEVLIAKRQDHVDQGGLWEFPGGKREVNESSFDALRRELAEELGISVIHATPFLSQDHEYEHKIVALEFFQVSRWNGHPHGAEGQTVVWIPSPRLSEYSFPAANEAVVRQLSR
ncbi:MAG: 8-oxo-dGTP diphosphatase MutT [Gammaproteobacteria bacterium]